MSPMKNIKSLITKHSASDQKNSVSTIIKKNTLKKAIAAASLKQDTSDLIEALAIAEEFESQIVRGITKEIDIDFNLGLRKKPECVDVNDEAVQSKIINTLTDEKSECILELQRKQKDMQDIHIKMQRGSNLWEVLVKKSEQMSNYLAKAEIELERLEEVETRFTKLYNASQALAKDHRELKLTLEEKYKQINLLEGHKYKTRDMLDKAQLEINRLVEERKAQTADVHSQEIVLSKLKDENLSIIEKNSILSNNLVELNGQIDDIKNKLEVSHNKLAENEKTISKSNLKIVTLSKENEKVAIDNLDIQARYGSLNDNYADTKAQLEEVKYNLNSERTAFDEKLRLKDARILKMERRIEVLTRQISLTEQMVADITDDKTVKPSSKLKEMKQPNCQSSNIKKNAFKTTPVAVAI